MASDADRIRRKHTSIIRHGRGKNSVRLTIDHQSFQIGARDFTLAEARWFARQLAIALARFRRGLT